METCDVIVIGGGPAGSTVAPLLAEQGYRVVMLEKSKHPRFHIGESLLPANLSLLRKLGVAEQVDAIGVPKLGAEFVSPWHDHTCCVNFSETWARNMPSAYQVRRSEFDEILFLNAKKKGVQTFEECLATAIQFEADGSAIVSAQSSDGAPQQWHAQFVVDASGRDTFMANKMQIKQANPHHNSAAIYGHFTGAIRNEGDAQGNTTIFWFDHGWFWFIPLRDGITSVGMVTWPYFLKTRKGRSLDQFLLDGITMCSKLAPRMASAQLVSEVEATGNYSYNAQRNHGANYLMLGDAYAFIDPVFSSGVMLAMQSGFAASEAIDTCLKNPVQKAQALRRFDRIMRHGPRTFSWLIYRMTNPIMRDLLMYPRNFLRMKDAVVTLLAGDIYEKTPIWNSLRAFKLVYYISNLLQPKRAWTARQRRKINIQQVAN